MTQDVQHDRATAPLATVSDAIHPPTRSRIPEPAADDTATPEPETPSTFDSDSFAGFGSFG
ncbi:hypothetical protein [Methylobacterium flocculans]|uniref:hypothetical protein n=1 Tax=Methylobacterium flocculans TaxID=2984843 RepID=UPI0021F33A5C|nr:hypothetical protein [Methylobacterium sp. FF17]